MSNEHEYKAGLSEDVYYPDHAPRTESSIFRKTKRDGKAAGNVCAISGHPEGVEYHHVFCEAAFANAVDWHTVKAIATGQIKTMPVLDLTTDQPTGATYPVSQSLFGILIALTIARGFDWAEFDPDKPETFVDSAANMLVLHEKFHRAKFHGMHENSLPIWIFQAFPRVPGFVYSPDEMRALHKVTV
jgi:hypothetical protein